MHVLDAPLFNITWWDDVDLTWRGYFVLTYQEAMTCAVFCTCLFITSSLCGLHTFYHRLAPRRRIIITVLKLVHIADIICFATVTVAYIYSAVVYNSGSCSHTCVDVNINDVRIYLFRSGLLVLHLAGVAALRTLYLFKDNWLQGAFAIPIIALGVIIPIGLVLWVYPHPVAVSSLLQSPPYLSSTTSSSSVFHLCLEDWNAPPTLKTLLLAIALATLFISLYALRLSASNARKTTTKHHPKFTGTSLEDGKNSFKQLPMSTGITDNESKQPQTSTDTSCTGSKQPPTFDDTTQDNTQNDKKDNHMQVILLPSLPSSPGDPPHQPDEPFDLVGFIIQVLLLSFPLQAALVTVGTLDEVARCLRAGSHLVLLAYLTLFGVVKLIMWPVNRALIYRQTKLVADPGSVD